MFASHDRIAFLATYGVKHEGYRAAVLVTTIDAEPLEFRCTSAVCPSRVQKAIWGGRLGGHLATHVLGKPLVDALDPPPRLVLTRQSQLLELRKLVACPVVQITEGEGGLRAWGDDAADLEAARAILRPLAGRVDLDEPFRRLKEALAAVEKEARADRE